MQVHDIGNAERPRRRVHVIKVMGKVRSRLGSAGVPPAYAFPLRLGLTSAGNYGDFSLQNNNSVLIVNTFAGEDASAPMSL